MPRTPSARGEGRGEGQRHTPTSNGVRPLASDLSASLKRGGEGSDPIPASGERESAAAERDYYVVEDTDGRRFWLFRHGLYGSTPNPQWFVHGIFA
jgi:hypothetical protein